MASQNLYKIPATIVTGFLGSGKTTLIRHLLESNFGRRIAVIINEFGDVGIDRALLEGCDVAACDDIIELTNGCLCCTVAEEFIPTIEKIVYHTDTDKRPDHIIIETSGLALPKPLVQAFQWPNIRARVMVDGVVVVVDAIALLDSILSHSPFQKSGLMDSSAHKSPIAETFTDQLLCADIVLLNKVDLLNKKNLPILENQLKSLLRNGVRLLKVHHGRANSALLLGLGGVAEENLAYEKNYPHDDNHTHDDFESFTLTLPAVSDVDVLEKSLLNVLTTHNIIRIKGFLDVPGKAMRLVVHGVGTRVQRYFDKPWRAAESRCSRLVVIGLKGLDRCAIATTLGGNIYYK